MSSSDASKTWGRRSVLTALVALPACGFTPVYGPAGVARGLTGQILVDEPEDEAGYLLVTRLEERLGRPNDAQYRLALDVSISDRRLGRNTQSSTAREQLVGRIRYRLIDRSTDQTLRRADLTNFTSYSSPLIDPDNTPDPGEPYVGSYVSIREARRDAGERLMTILADSIVADLLATAPDWQQ
ncbi:LPS assembly lipoprotein LptE [Palleronia abyssalis]|uniref:LPS-assembly lipoprotein LptE n=1 Tax=Palleronia abyssalis TaxID=1501240 RepID=A0A2R8BT68_9RHOB|nr:LPS assembly lipoprotein LptE [Palleronia abyssalis]SPJ23318.1 hypothetical protein PAA8504_01128 [Palleronia abyssalis]